MKRQQPHFIAALIFVCATLAILYAQLNPGASPQGSASAQVLHPAPVDAYYYGSREAIPLTIRTDVVVVRFKSGVSEISQSNRLLAEDNLDPEAEWRILNERLGVSVVGVTAGRRAADITATVESLRTAAEVYWASPLYETRPGFPISITNEFYISAPLDTLEEDIFALNQQMGVEVVRHVDRSSIGLTAYWLRVTESSPYSTLDMANFYYEESQLGLTGAQPQFGFHYSRLASSVPNDPYYDEDYPTTGEPGQWSFEAINMPDAWDICKGNSEIVIAVLDSGFDLHFQQRQDGVSIVKNVGHEDLVDNQWVNPGEIWTGADDPVGEEEEGDENTQSDDIYGWDFVDNDNLPLFDTNDQIKWHGTMSAGVVAAVSDNGTGVAGVAGGWNGSPDGCRIMPIRVTDIVGYDEGDLADGIDYARLTGANIITMSLGQYVDATAVSQAVLQARAAGIVLVAAAHNFDSHTPTYPAKYPGVICVGAVNKCSPPERKYGSESSSLAPEYWPACNEHVLPGPGITYWGSNWGWEIDIMAPGMHYYTTDITGSIGFDGDYSYYYRTSSATPQVAGVAALIQSAMLDRGWPLMSPTQIQAILAFSADDMSYSNSAETAGSGRDEYTGYGLLDAYAALTMAITPPTFILRDGQGKHIASIDEFGDLIIEGGCVSNRTNEEMEWWADYGRPSFSIADDSGNPRLIVDTAIVYLGSTVIGGNTIFHTVSVYTEQATLSPNEDSFVVRNSGGQCVAYFDASGSIFLKGRLFEGWDPDPNA